MGAFLQLINRSLATGSTQLRTDRPISSQTSTLPVTERGGPTSHSNKRRSSRNQAAKNASGGAVPVELALALPILLLLLLGIIEAGLALNAQITMRQAAAEAARLASVGENIGPACDQLTDLSNGTVSGLGISASGPEPRCRPRHRGHTPASRGSSRTSTTSRSPRPPPPDWSSPAEGAPVDQIASAASTRMSRGSPALAGGGMAAFLGIAAIVIDIGLAMSQGRLDQNAADFAALAAANDAYLGITPMQSAAQEITNDNFGESVPLSGCSTELTQPGSPFSPITDCMSVAPFGDLNSESIRRVGQTWIGVPDQTSGPAFGPPSRRGARQRQRSSRGQRAGWHRSWSNTAGLRAGLPRRRQCSCQRRMPVSAEHRQQSEVLGRVVCCRI